MHVLRHLSYETSTAVIRRKSHLSCWPLLIYMSAEMNDNNPKRQDLSEEKQLERVLCGKQMFEKASEVTNTLKKKKKIEEDEEHHNTFSSEKAMDEDELVKQYVTKLSILTFIDSFKVLFL
ncbi:uncharacterized protein LOC134239395 isoform X2 [Saccostrea cucullata]|uniref:uncharacterized protein LOC134239395 isoform X2 n=1 Tax=Saccostrea cuccullata TaxID=36930 RepID=UPI002ED0B7B2